MFGIWTRYRKFWNKIRNLRRDHWGDNVSLASVRPEIRNDLIEYSKLPTTAVDALLQRKHANFRIEWENDPFQVDYWF